MNSQSHPPQINCLWQKIYLPDLEQPPQVWEDPIFKDQIPQVRKIALENNDIKVPDPKAFRSMSRASLFLSSFAEEIKPVIQPYLDRSPFSVGIYCAVENGPIDGPSTQEILNRCSDSFDFQFAEAYRKLRNPKMYLKQLPNLVPAQFGISLGIQGPMNVYTHSQYGGSQALFQAQVDLFNQFVEVAIVMSAHAFDDFWVMKRSRLQDERVLCEGAAIQILSLTAPDSPKTPLHAAHTDSIGMLNEKLAEMKKSIKQNNLCDSVNYFGIADSLINLIRKENAQ